MQNTYSVVYEHHTKTSVQLNVGDPLVVSVVNKTKLV